MLFNAFWRASSLASLIRSSRPGRSSRHSASVVTPIPATVHALLIGIPSASASQSRAIVVSLYLVGRPTRDSFNSLLGIFITTSLVVEHFCGERHHEVTRF